MNNLRKTGQKVMDNKQQMKTETQKSFRDLHIEDGALTGLTFGPNVSAHTFHSLSRHGETNAGAGIPFRLLETMKYLEYSVMVLHIKTDPVISHPYNKPFFRRITTNCDHWSRHVTGKLEKPEPLYSLVHVRWQQDNHLQLSLHRYNWLLSPPNV